MWNPCCSLYSVSRKSEEMNIIIIYLVFFTLVVTHPIGTSLEVIAYRVESKIFNGNPAIQGERRYMASLQLNNNHVCGSGALSMNFLITSGQCVVHIEAKVTLESQNGTAVLEHVSLVSGKVYDIIDLISHPNFKPNQAEDTTDFDVGVIKIKGYADLWKVHVPPLYKGNYDLSGDENAYVCGWGSIDKDDCANNIGDYNISSNDLHCMQVQLKSREFCTDLIEEGDFYKSQFCGLGKYPNQRIGLADIGSPLMMTVRNLNFIAGIITGRLDKNDITYIKSVRTSSVHTDIRNMMDQLMSQAETDSSCSSTGSNSSPRNLDSNGTRRELSYTSTSSNKRRRHSNNLL